MGYLEDWGSLLFKVDYYKGENAWVPTDFKKLPTFHSLNPPQFRAPRVLDLWEVPGGFHARSNATLRGSRAGGELAAKLASRSVGFYDC